MSDDAPWAIDCLARWRPRAGWRSTVDEAARAFDGGDHAHGWATLAMMFGDTGATGLALIVCMHGIATCGASDRLYGHRDLCLMDLGLARTVKPGAVAIAELGAPATLAIDNDALDAWMARELAPFAGDLAAAARFARALAEARVGIGAEPQL